MILKSIDEEITLKVLEIKKQGACGKVKFSVGIIKVEGESNSLKSLPEEVLGKISQVASIKIPKLRQEGKKIKKKEHQP